MSPTLEGQDKINKRREEGKKVYNLFRCESIKTK